MKITFFYLGRYLKKLADDQFSSLTKGRIYHINHMYIQPFTQVVDWPEICFTYVDTAFLLGRSDVTMRCLKPACVQYHGQHVHITLCTKPYFHIENVRRFQIHLDRRVLMIVKLCPVKSEINSPLKIVNLSQNKKNKFVFRSAHAFWVFLPQITAFTIFIWTFSKIKIKLPISR